MTKQQMTEVGRAGARESRIRWTPPRATIPRPIKPATQAMKSAPVTAAKAARPWLPPPRHPAARGRATPSSPIAPRNHGVGFEPRRFATARPIQTTMAAGSVNNAPATTKLKVSVAYQVNSAPGPPAPPDRAVVTLTRTARLSATGWTHTCRIAVIASTPATKPSMWRSPPRLAPRLPPGEIKSRAAPSVTATTVTAGHLVKSRTTLSIPAATPWAAPRPAPRAMRRALRNIRVARLSVMRAVRS